MGLSIANLSWGRVVQAVTNTEPKRDAVIPAPPDPIQYKKQTMEILDKASGKAIEEVSAEGKSEIQKLKAIVDDRNRPEEERRAIDLVIREVSEAYNSRSLRNIAQEIIKEEVGSIWDVPVSSGHPILAVDQPNFKVLRHAEGLCIFRRGWTAVVNDPGIMEWQASYLWEDLNNNKKYEESERNRVGWTRKAEALLQGKTFAEAEKIFHDGRDAHLAIQKDLEKKRGIQRLGGDMTDFLQQHGGKIVQVIGAVAVIIPYVGPVISPLIIAAGTVLDKAQQAMYIAKLANRRKQDLEKLANRYEWGEITLDEYNQQVSAIAKDEFDIIFAEEKAIAALKNKLDSGQITPAEYNAGMLAIANASTHPEDFADFIASMEQQPVQGQEQGQTQGQAQDQGQTQGQTQDQQTNTTQVQDTTVTPTQTVEVTPTQTTNVNVAVSPITGQPIISDTELQSLKATTKSLALPLVAVGGVALVGIGLLAALMMGRRS